MPDGTTVSSQRYLADTAGAARAVADFSALLSQVSPHPRKAGLQALASELAAARDRAAVLAGRLASERLDDSRLETQRGEAAAVLDDVITAMDALVVAARAGDARASAAASRAFTTAVGRLRSLPSPA